jgi:uncharacterized cupin superfamily protein
VSELPPGKVSPYHWQVGEEEWLLVLEGEPTLRTPGGEERLRPWDIALFVRGEKGAHQVRNDTGSPVRVAFFSSVADPEVAVYPDDGKVGVVAGWSRDDMETIRGPIEVER